MTLILNVDASLPTIFCTKYGNFEFQPQEETRLEKTHQEEFSQKDSTYKEYSKESTQRKLFHTFNPLECRVIESGIVFFFEEKQDTDAPAILCFDEDRDNCVINITEEIITITPKTINKE